MIFYPPKNIIQFIESETLDGRDIRNVCKRGESFCFKLRFYPEDGSGEYFEIYRSKYVLVLPVLLSETSDITGVINRKCALVLL